MSEFYDTAIPIIIVWIIEQYGKDSAPFVGEYVRLMKDAVSNKL